MRSKAERGFTATFIVGRLSLPLLFATLFLVIDVVADDYHLFVVSQLVVFSIAAVGTSLLFGRSGPGGHPVLMSFGQSAFMAIGAYLTAILMGRYGWNFWLALLLAVGAAVLVAAVLAALSTSLGPFGFALTTFLAAFVVQQFLTSGPLIDYTGAAFGVTVPPASIAGFSLAIGNSQYMIVCSAAVILVLIANIFLRSRSMYAWQLLGASEYAAMSFGVAPRALKIKVFCFSAAYCAIAGALLAQLLGQISPDSVGPTVSVQIAAIVVVGGAGTIAGAFLGTAVFLLPALLLTGIGQNAAIYFSLLLLIALMFAPNGLMGLAEALRARLRRTPRGPTAIGAKPVAKPELVTRQAGS